jgi:eukaryotic-like serine/threonine-protein kinase
VEVIVGFPADWCASAGVIVSTLDGDLWLWAAGKSTRLTQTPAVETMPAIAPNGKWIAYVSNETGRPEVWVQSFPAPGAKFQVSTTGAAWPHWRSDGKELFYVSERKMFAAAVRVDPVFEADEGKPLFTVGNQQNYASAGNGSRFLVRVADEGSTTVAYTVMTNWLATQKK